MNHGSRQQTIDRLWILDLDGTLMPTQDLDNACYWRAVDDTVGGAPSSLDLGSFEHVTDSGILDEWMRRTRGRPPHDGERLAIRHRFLERLIAEQRRRPQAFQPLPGLVRWLDQMLDRRGTRLAIATGGWSHTARFKLRAAGLDRYRLPLATGDDALRRADIIAIARQRAVSREPGAATLQPGARTICIGDGIWDLLAARELGWDFIGLASGANAERLSAAGAGTVITDFNALLTELAQVAGGHAKLADVTR